MSARKKYRFVSVVRGSYEVRDRIRRSKFSDDTIAALVAASEINLGATGGNALPVTGYCHECDRRISGERKFCGPCLARRMTNRGT